MHITPDSFHVTGFMSPRLHSLEQCVTQRCAQTLQASVQLPLHQAEGQSPKVGIGFRTCSAGVNGEHLLLQTGGVALVC